MIKATKKDALSYMTVKEKKKAWTKQSFILIIQIMSFSVGPLDPNLFSTKKPSRMSINFKVISVVCP